MEAKAEGGALTVEVASSFRPAVSSRLHCGNDADPCDGDDRYDDDDCYDNDADPYNADDCYDNDDDNQ